MPRWGRGYVTARRFRESTMRPDRAGRHGAAARRLRFSIPRFIDSPKNHLPWGDFGIRDGA